MLDYFLMTLLLVTAIFLVLLVLIQRGRGGGLAGAFGGMGGQSAFGTKAGDVFTRVTIVTAAFWILLCCVSVKIFSSGENRLASDLGGSAKSGEPTGSETLDKTPPPSKAPAGKDGAKTSSPKTDGDATPGAGASDSAKAAGTGKAGSGDSGKAGSGDSGKTAPAAADGAAAPADTPAATPAGAPSTKK